MPFSFGLVGGILAILAGAILYAATGRKKSAMVVVGAGVVVALLTLAVLVLAVNSRM